MLLLTNKQNKYFDRKREKRKSNGNVKKKKCNLQKYKCST